MTDADQIAARADFCRFLAACYYEPAPEFAEERLFESMGTAARVFDAELSAGARRLGEAWSGASLENLLVDYTRLFLGPVEARARPYGSVWLDPDRLTMRESTADVIALYEEGGFEIAEDFRELPDHVAAELEFLYLLLFREAQALRAGDAAGRAAADRLRRRLMTEHLGRWIEPFTQSLAGGAQSAFFRELAGITRRLVSLESARTPGN